MGQASRAPYHPRPGNRALETAPWKLRPGNCALEHYERARIGLLGRYGPVSFCAADM